VRVVLLADPLIKVPPDHYGGIERVVADLGDGLARRGHDVTLWAAPGRLLVTISPLAHEREYFHREVEPQLDGDLVMYVGPVDDRQKRVLLGQAAACSCRSNGRSRFRVCCPSRYCVARR
jgi:hypothetical protein